MTEWLEGVTRMVREQKRKGKPKEVGVRIYPNLQTNSKTGIDILDWIGKGLVDYVVPVMYSYNSLDPDMPFDWVIDPAHEADIPVYGFLQHYVRSEDTGAVKKEYPTPEIMRAAAANYWAKGVDGVYTWYMHWPLGVVERSILTEIGDADVLEEKNKHYVLARRIPTAVELGYDAPLPVTLTADTGKGHTIPFFIADDIEIKKQRIADIRLKIYISNTVCADQYSFSLNGKPLTQDMCRRVIKSREDAFIHSGWRHHWLIFDLTENHPQKGSNTLEISLDSRPAKLRGHATVEEVEIIIKYSPYTSA